MAQTESKIRLIFEGVERGVDRAAAKASRAVKSLDDDNSKLSKSASGAEKALMGVGKGMLAISGASSAVGVIGGAAAAAVQLSGALLLVPGAAAAAKIGFNAINMGAGDFLAAMGNLSDNKAFKKNMEAMGDSAKGVAGQIKIAHDELADGLGETMFDGIEEKLKPLIASTLPRLKASYESIGKSVNTTGKAVLDFLNQSKRQDDLNRLIGDSSAIWGQLLKSVVPLAGAFLDVAVVGSGSLRKLTAGVSGAAQRFADFVAKAREAGQIQKWIDGGVQGFRDLGGIVKNVGSIIGTVLKGLGADVGSPLGRIRELTAQVDQFLKTAAAQDGLRALGEALRVVGEVVGDVVMTALKELAPTLVELAPVAQEIARTLGDLLVGALETLGPIIRGIASVLADFPGVVSAATVAVVGFVAAVKTIKAVNAVSEILGIGSAIGGVGDKAKVSEGKVGGLVTKLGGLKGIAGAAALGAIAYGMDQINKSSSEGNLSGWNGELHDLVRVMTGDWGNALDDMSAQLDQWKRNLQAGFNTDGSSNIGKFFGWLRQQMNDPLPPIVFNVDDGPAVRTVDRFIGDVNSRTPQVNINGNTNGAGFALRTILDAINRGEGSVTIDGRPMPAQDALRYVVGLINNSAGTTTINGQNRPAGDALADILRRTNGSSAAIRVGADTSAADAAGRALIARWNGRQIYVNFGGSRVTGATGGAVTGGAIVPHFGVGGPVSGRGSGTSDSVPAMLSNGEYVMNAAEVRAAGGFAGMAAISDMLRGQGASPVAAAAAGRTATAAAAMRPVARPAAQPSGGTQVTFAGNTSDALATVIMGMIRQGKIQIKAA